MKYKCHTDIPYTTQTSSTGTAQLNQWQVRGMLDPAWRQYRSNRQYGRSLTDPTANRPQGWKKKRARGHIQQNQVMFGK